MSEQFCSAHSVSFSFESQIAPLFVDLSFTFPLGWTGLVGANGSGKTTLARILVGDLAPTDGSVARPARTHYCAQSAAEMPRELLDLVSSPDSEDFEILRRLGVQFDWPYRWDSLSFGERKRAQVASALYLRPGLLALDEPTNHLDEEATTQLAAALERYSGIGLLISHDRELLDRVCGRCLFISPGGVVLRPGGISDGLREEAREAESARRERREAKEELVRLRQETTRRRAEADAADARRSKRGIARKDRDAKGKIDLARVSGKDRVAGKLLRQMDHRISRAEERLAATRPTSVEPSGITLAGEASRRDLLFRLGPADLPLGERRFLSIPELTMGPRERIVITGPNGSGKSTLLRAIVGELFIEDYLFMTQELSPTTDAKLMSDLDNLNPKERGEVLSAVKRLGSEPELLLSTARPSPGEARKLFVALAVGRSLQLVVMDEPTNHMDLPSILRLEEALDASPAALLFVTHDRPFAKRLATRHWQVGRSETHPGWFRLIDET